ncbi:LysR family transcriptional regulator [Brevibacillus invocatus]|uniref:LysR family transcriptional regulator n=1 Tax=Brevibacillus invocatus TaxID=173959 RepID=UPI00203B4FA2|nr:LysR family transcriptional regulator [Brevibacillus invocatus]MCM3081440.1 LysR family transcriptional regulator [Brevibacillus invocatus]MCM3431784.1 LysR family transcriptional regulator [Brevibacillus invocatus]
MNMEQIEAFIFVSLTGSFSKTAELLYLSQPTVSMRIKALESSLDCKLFQRSGHMICLTKEGEIFLPYAKSILHSLQEGQQAIQRSYGDIEGELTIATVFVAAFYILPDLVEQFQQLYPKVKLTILTGHSHQVLDMVLNHEVSFGIARAVTHPQINQIQLMSDQMVLAIYPEHPFSSRQQVSIEEVARERLILFNRGSLDWKLIDSAFTHYQLKNRVVMEVDNIEVVKRMVRQKLGIAFVPRFSIQKDLANGELHEVEVLNLPQINRNFELIYLKDTPFHGIMRTFVDFLMQSKLLQ